MFRTLQGLVERGAVGRATLLVNHVLGSEPIAAARLRQHAGRSIQLRFVGWPSVLPALPATAFRVTPAGLLEWCGPDDPGQADLQVDIDAANPLLMGARLAAGELPRVEVAGDAALAADVDWLFDTLRWDVQDDLERIVGPAPAGQLMRLGRAVAAGVRAAARRLGTVVAERAPAATMPPRGSDSPAEPRWR